MQSPISYVVVEGHAAVPRVPCHVDVLGFGVHILLALWYVREKCAYGVAGSIVPGSRQILKKGGVSHKVFVITERLPFLRMSWVIHWTQCVPHLG